MREYTYVYAAVSPHDGVMDSLILPEANSGAMSIFLAEVAARHVDELIIMVVDRAGWHSSAALQVPGNIHLISLPPYSPELNPTEHIWEEIREKWLTNQVFESLAVVENQLVKALVSLENDQTKVQSITGFH